MPGTHTNAEMQRLLDAAQAEHRQLRAQQILDDEERARKLLQQQIIAEILADASKVDLKDPAVRRAIREELHMDPREYGHPERGMGRMLTRGFKHDDLVTLKRMEAEVMASGVSGIDAALAIWKKFEGQAETGADNHGAVVALVGGIQGQPWCGAALDYACEKGFPGVWKPANRLLASSYMDDAKNPAHNSFRAARSAYIPRPGDLVFLNHHVGMVVDVSENGDVTYSSGNYADAFGTAKFNVKNPPGDVFGFGDTHAQAAAKGKSHLLHASAGTPRKAEAAPNKEQIASGTPSPALSDLKLDVASLNLAYSHIAGAPSDVPAQTTIAAAKPVAERAPA